MAMIKKTSHLFAAFLFSAIVFPFFSFIRFYPLPDWVSSAIALTFLGCCLVCACVDNVKLYLSPVAIFTLFFGLVCLIQNRFDSLSVGLVFLLLFFVMLCVPAYFEKERDSLFYMLAGLVLVAALLQACLGWLQLLGLAKDMHGLVLFDRGNPAGNIMGNIGQRNQYAQFLMWGCIAACFLRAKEKLGFVFFACSVVVLSLLISWTGARLPVVYCLSIVMLTWLWVRSNGGSASVRRMAIAIVFTAGLIVFVQLFNREIIELLRLLGFGFDMHSGVERISEGGMGARRRVEWAKALDIFWAHPILGVGLGGYAAESVWAEVSSGLPKVPESWLFTNSHNLVFQLLAETGFVGGGVALGGLIFGAVPYFKKGMQSAENLFLISILSMLLIHSLLEYPLWYLSFLIMLFLVFSISPVFKFELDIRALVKRSILAIVVVGCLGYVVTSIPIYRGLVKYSQPSNSESERKEAVKVLNASGSHPLWSWDADLALANYLQASKEQLPLKLALFERLSSYRPYPNVLIKLATLRALSGDQVKAKQALAMAIANYPEYLAGFALALALHSEPEIRPLREMVETAGRAYAKYPAHSEEAQRAAIMTVASPVVREPLLF